MPILFGITLFLSAVLLFLIQPMIAKMILPLLGGSPAVWLTCMVFFQAVLLAGYVYAHTLTTRLRLSAQPLVHVLVLALPLLALPLVSLPVHLARETVPYFGGTFSAWLGEPPLESNPIPWLLVLLFVSVGLPFFAVSTSAPLLQKWFGTTSHTTASDPYFLYAASNTGSMAALLGYPVLVEPLLGLLPQGWLWAGGYAVLLVLVATCAVVLRRARQGSGAQEKRSGGAGQGGGREAAGTHHSILSSWRRFRWLALSFVPSSLLYGVTTYLSTDIAAVPLLWIAPLSLYLLTFILAFARRRLLSHRIVGLALPALIVVQLFVLLILIYGVLLPLTLLIVLHLLTFFVAALLCHGELAEDRPPPERLTEFYLWLSLGGVLGGLFNALVAPLLFTSIVEYPLGLLLACLLGHLPARLFPEPAVAPPVRNKPRPKRVTSQASSTADLVGWLLPPALGVLASLLMIYLQFDLPGLGRLKGSLMVGLPLACYLASCFFSRRPLWFGIPLAVMLVTCVAGLAVQGMLLHAERGFYGVLRVTLIRDEDRKEEFVQLFHGSTLHGKQRRTDDPDKRREPLTYYHPDGPIGQVFAEFSGSKAKKHVGLIGLGTGSLASYGGPGQEFTFYEIDAAVVRIARDHFSFLRECRANHRIVLGDARLSLKRADDGQFGLLVVDAFSSDAIPVHLLTREACAEVYLRKLADDGVLAFHISNRYLDLRPVLANLAEALGLVGRLNWDERGDDKTGRTASGWVILARKEADLGQLAGDSRWQPLQPRVGMEVWTDDYSNLLSVVRW